jgi:hypothetical protein
MYADWKLPRKPQYKLISETLYASLKKEQNKQILPQLKRKKTETPTHKA